MRRGQNEPQPQVARPQQTPPQRHRHQPEPGDGQHRLLSHPVDRPAPHRQRQELRRHGDDQYDQLRRAAAQPDPVGIKQVERNKLLHEADGEGEGAHEGGEPEELPVAQRPAQGPQQTKPAPRRPGNQRDLAGLYGR